MKKQGREERMKGWSWSHRTIGKSFSNWGMPHKTQKNSNHKSSRLTQNIRSITSAKMLN